VHLGEFETGSDGFFWPNQLKPQDPVQDISIKYGLLVLLPPFRGQPMVQWLTHNAAFCMACSLSPAACGLSPVAFCLQFTACCLQFNAIFAVKLAI
jgi:hypothetical protein